MARIAEQEIEQLKADVSVERLIEAAGITLKKSGKDKLGLCPFHDDKEASLVVSPAKNLWHCFVCQCGGGPIDLVMKLQGVSFRHAVELLKNDPSLAAGAVAAQGGATPGTRVRSLPAPIEFDADDQALLNQSIDYYHETLKTSPEALAYLKGRGLAHPELIMQFKLGYANRTLGLRLPSTDRQEGLSIRTRLQKVGIYRESGHEHFNGSLVVPIMDGAGNVVEVYGRKIRDDLRKGTPLHLYLPGPHRGVWNEVGLATSKEIILCEALIDAMTVWSAGYSNVTAAYGVEGFTADHLAVLKRLGTERVVIAYDRDDAGERAAVKLAAQLIGEGIECLRAHFPHGMDANSYALKVTPAHRSIGLVIRQAEWIGRPRLNIDTHAASPAPAPKPAPAPAPTQAHAPESAPAPARTQAPTQAPTPTQAPAPAPTQAPTPAHESAPAPVHESAPAPTAGAPTYTGEAHAHEPGVAHPSLAAAVADDSASSASGTDGRPADSRPGELLLTLGDRHWRVRGWHKNLSPEQMRVNLQVRRSVAELPDAYHVDTLDMYTARGRAAFIKQAALELGLPDADIKQDMGQVLLKLEILQDEAIRSHSKQQNKVKAMTAAEEAAALALLQAPNIVARIVEDMHACGVVGEANNLLAGYLAAVSRKLDTPLAILIQSSSAAGKSSLMDAVLAMVPEEEKMLYSAMTGQSLFYLGETDMQHKILAIAEEEGVRQAAYALKLLQSDGELTMASTGKDDVSGELTTKQYKVKGPVMLMLTTTAIDVDEELMNRCMVLTVNESREQTRAIHDRQRMKQTLAGLIASSARSTITSLHQNAQRLLKPVMVVNPFADQLTFMSDKTRTRRDHMKYLTLIRAIALLHQHQRPVQTVEHGGQTLAYIEANQADIALANSIAHQVLGSTLDELPPQTRRLLSLLQEWVSQCAQAQALPVSEFRFTRKAVRDEFQWGDTQLKLHLARLADLEYLMVHRCGSLRGANHFEYELVYDGEKDAGAHLSGLIDVNKLNYDGIRSGVNVNWSEEGLNQSGLGRVKVGPKSGVGRGAKNTDFSYEEVQKSEKNAKTHVYGKSENRSRAVVDAVVGGHINGQAKE